MRVDPYWSYITEDLLSMVRCNPKDLVSVRFHEFSFLWNIVVVKIVLDSE